MAVRGIYLIGFSGTGKSTIARAVGVELGWPACDLDDLVVERSGMSVPDIFAREGEAGFRAREAEALRAASEVPPFVIATGGGAPLRVENRRLMASKGWIVALEGRPEVLGARLQRQLEQADPNATRPLLGAGDPLDRIRGLKRRRQSVYALADWTVHTDRLTPAQVAAEVVRAVRLLETTADPVAGFDVPAGPEDEAASRPGSGAPVGRKRIEVRGAPIAGGKVPLVCAPLVAAGREALLAEAAAVSARGPDVVEWRADFFAGLARTGEVVDLARSLRAAVAPAPLLFTIRSAAEGGQAVPISGREVVALHEAVCAAGVADLVDFETRRAPEEVRRVREAARRAGAALVLSHHDFARTPPAEALVEELREAQRLGADVAKLAVMPRSRDDVLALLSATLRADGELRIPLATVSMGAEGSLTRVCGWMFGSALTFAVGRDASAPGQIPIDELRSAIAVLRRASGAGGA